MSVSIVCVCVCVCVLYVNTIALLKVLSNSFLKHTQTYDNSSKYGQTWLLYKGREREGERKSSAESLITGSIRD